MLKLPLTIVVAAAACIVMATGVSNVSAHARVKESTPAAGEVLEASPAEVSITFTNDIQKIAGTYGIEVTDETGTAVTTGPAVLDDANRSLLTVQLQPALAPGRYIVKYTNVSDADGDPYEGAFAFYVGVEPTEEQLAADRELQPEEPTPTVAAATPTPAVDVESSPTAVVAGSGDDGGDDNRGLITALFIVAAVAAIGVGVGVVWLSSRGRAE